MPRFPLGLLTALAVLAACAAACGGGGEDGPLRVGVMQSLTGPGATSGNALLLAQRMAVDEINEAGGVRGRQLELVVADSRCSPEGAIEAYRRLTDEEGVRIVLGPTCSGAMLAAAPLAEADGVVLFSSQTTSPRISGAGDYVFRNAPSDARLAADMAAAMRGDGVRRLATMTEDTDYANDLTAAVAASFAALGGEVAAAASYASDAAAYDEPLTALIAASPDAVLAAPQGQIAGGRIVRRLRELGYEGAIYTASVGSGWRALEEAGGAADGLRVVMPNPFLSTGEGRALLARYREQHGAITIGFYLGAAWDGVHIAAECLRRSGDAGDAEWFRDCLYGIVWSGAIGDGYRFDANGDVVGIGNARLEVLPAAERNAENEGYRLIGPASAP